MQQLRYLLNHNQLGPILWRSLSVIGLIVVLRGGYLLFGQPITLIVNGQSHQVRVRDLKVKAILQELGLALQAKDIVRPSRGGQLSPGDTVTIQLARPVMIKLNDHTRQILTQQQTIAGVLAEAGVALTRHDEILVNGIQASPESLLPLPRLVPSSAQTGSNGAARSKIALIRPKVVQLEVGRAVPVTLNQGQASRTIYTNQSSVGQLLKEQGFLIDTYDEIIPKPETPLSPGMEIDIRRSTPIIISIDGHHIEIDGRDKRVGKILDQAGIVLGELDFTQPPLDHLVTVDDIIEVVRVQEVVEVIQEPIPFETTWIDDPDMGLDQKEERQSGANGILQTRLRIRYENEQEVSRNIEEEWLDPAPRDQVIAYGTKIVIRTLDTPQGPLEYWRKISMLITPYNAISSGKSPDHPRYGMTRTGLRVGYGIAAVDPKVIPLRTKLYVSDYGPALAADTGSRVLGKHIDVAYDDDQPLPPTHGWGDVYVLTPVPPADKIRYILPDWPQP